MAADITPAMNEEFQSSKRFRLSMLLVQAGIVAVTLLSLDRNGIWTRYSGVAALVATGISFWLKYLSQKHFTKGEGFRRKLFFTKSQDRTLPPHLEALIATDYSSSSKAPLLREDEYYDSNAPKGYARMLANLQESAFYTRKLAKSSKLVFGSLTILGAVVAVLYLLYIASVPEVASTTLLKRAADITTKLLAFFVLGQYSELWYAFYVLENAAEETYRSTSELIDSKASVDESVLELVSEYDCALASSSPIPTLIWKCHKTALERGWDVIKLSRSNNHTAAPSGRS